jgi:hypothetical protein
MLLEARKATSSACVVPFFVSFAFGRGNRLIGGPTFALSSTTKVLWFYLLFRADR